MAELKLIYKHYGFQNSTIRLKSMKYFTLKNGVLIPKEVGKTTDIPTSLFTNVDLEV